MTVRVLCCRMSDLRNHRGVRLDTLIRRCELCGSDVFINPETMVAVQDHAIEICCLECNVGSGIPIVGQVQPKETAP